MDIQQVKWASQHDWYRDHFVCGNVYFVVVRSETGKGFQTFGDFQKLREWAGY